MIYYLLTLVNVNYFPCFLESQQISMLPFFLPNLTCSLLANPVGLVIKDIQNDTHFLHVHCHHTDSSQHLLLPG